MSASPATSSRTLSPLSSPTASPRASKSIASPFSSPTTPVRRHATYHDSADAKDAVRQALLARKSRRGRPSPYVKPRPPTSDPSQVSTSGLLSPLKPEGRTIYGFGLRLGASPEERPAHLWMEELAAHEHRTREASGVPALEAVAAHHVRRMYNFGGENTLPILGYTDLPDVSGGSSIGTGGGSLTKEEEEALWQLFINPEALA